MIAKTFLRPPSISFLLTSCMVLAGGCSQPSNQPAEASAEPVSMIIIESNDRMRFSPSTFTVQADAEITLTLSNIGSMPKETMGHNLVILQSDVSPNSFAAAAVRHYANDYLPPAYAEGIIAATTVLGPGETQTITFKAPATPGTYPFVCSFPGHTQAGMKGLMTVVP